MFVKRYLVLENGKIFEGEAFGAEGEEISEIVFTTSMTAYLETLTDPSYKGQAVTQTFPLIGNYGIITPDKEGQKPYVSGYIVRSACSEPSNFRAEETNVLKRFVISATAQFRAPAAFFGSVTTGISRCGMPL